MHPSDSNLHDVLSKALLAALVVDPHGTITFANAAAEGTFGHPAADLVGRPLELLIPPALRGAHRRGFERYMLSPTALTLSSRPTLRALHRDGHEFPIDIRLSPIETVEGPRIYCIFQDVSSQQRMQADLDKAFKELEGRAAASDAAAKSRAELLELFVKHAPAAVAMLDRNMNYLMVSNRWLRDYRLGEANVLGKCHYDIFPNTPGLLRQAHRICLGGEVVGPAEIPYTRDDGTVDWLQGEMRPWFERDGKVGGIVLFSEIITPRKEAEVRLRESHQMLEDRVSERTAALAQAKAEAEAASAMKSWFIGAAGHDLRQPLQASQSYLKIVEQKLERADLKEIAAKARQSLSAMAGILDVLLDIGQLDSGTIKPRFADFSVRELVARVIANCQPQAAIKDLSLRCEGEDCIVRSDPALLERIVTNFVANAVRYTHAGGVTVRCAARDGIVRLSVCDTGIGIPQDAIGRIFDDYIQLGNAARDRQRGLGLGLSIAKRLAQLLGHSIAVDSTPGEGSTFTIELPQGSVEAVAEPAPRQAVSPALAPAKLLLVDDDPSVSESLTMLLETYGMTVHTAASGAEARARIMSGIVPDVVVTDYRLPDHDGFDVIARVRAMLGRTVPAVLITGDTRPKPAAPPDNFALLHKPFQVEDLVALIEKMRGGVVSPG